MLKGKSSRSTFKLSGHQRQAFRPAAGARLSDGLGITLDSAALELTTLQPPNSKPA